MLCNPFNSESRKVYVVSYASVSDFPVTGSIDTIYIDDSTNEIYRWTGSAYVVIGEYPSVPTYADLPPAALNNGKVYLVTTSTGIWPFSHPAGFYISNGITWTQIPATAGAITYADLFATSPITYDGAGTYGLNWNTTNLKLTSTALNTIQDIALASSPQFTGLTLSGLTASYAVVTDGSKNLTSLQYTPSNIASTIMSRDSNGDFIARKANLTTLSVSADGNIAGYTTLGAAGGVILDQKLMVRGPTNDITGPHWAAYTTSDLYPVFQQLNWAHNIIAQNFDCYWDGATWKSSTTSSNFQLYKFNNQFQYNYASSVAAGSPITWNTAGYIDLITGTLIWNKQGKFNDTTDSSSISTGGITTLGGLGVAKNITATSMVLGSGNSALRFTNSVQNRKIELYRVTDNDHQFYGFGINSNVLRYQVPDSTMDNHVFYAGLSTTTSLELLRIKGTGVINIPGLTASSVILTNGSKDLISATVLPMANGGTNANLTASNGGIFYSTASAGAILGGTATANQLLISGATSAPSWTSFYKDFGSSGATLGNLFVGTSCGQPVLTSIVGNTALGVEALSSIAPSVAAGKNTAIGYRALRVINQITNTGNLNTAIGWSAGSADEALVQCCFLGASSNVSVGGLTNAIAIGYNAIESESNSMTLGNTSLAKIKTTAKIIVSTAVGAQGLDLATADSYANLRVIQNTTGTDKHIYIGFNGATPSDVRLYSDSTETMRISGGNAIVGLSTIATNATNGFLRIPTCAGTPTGIPAQGNGCMVMDTTNNRLYIYSSSAWRPAM